MPTPAAPIVRPRHRKFFRPGEISDLLSEAMALRSELWNAIMQQVGPEAKALLYAHESLEMYSLHLWPLACLLQDESGPNPNRLPKWIAVAELRRASVEARELLYGDGPANPTLAQIYTKQEWIPLPPRSVSVVLRASARLPQAGP